MLLSWRRRRCEVDGLHGRCGWCRSSKYIPWYFLSAVGRRKNVRRCAYVLQAWKQLLAMPLLIISSTTTTAYCYYSKLLYCYSTDLHLHARTSPLPLAVRSSWLLPSVQISNFSTQEASFVHFFDISLCFDFAVGIQFTFLFRYEAQI